MRASRRFFRWGINPGIRMQLLLPFSLLMILPFFADFWLDNWSFIMLEDQRHEVISDAKYMARSLEASESLIKKIALRSGEQDKRDLLADLVDDRRMLDGRDDDWFGVQKQFLGVDDLVDINRTYRQDSFSAEYKLGTSDNYLYLFIKVLDDVVIYREINNPSVHRNDNLQIAVVNPDGEYRRYTIAAFQPAPIKAHQVSSSGRSLRQEELIDAVWLGTESGYNLELKIPLSLVGEKFSFVLADIDDQKDRDIHYLMGSSSVDSAAQLVNLIRPSLGAQKMLASLENASIRLFDAKKRIVSLSPNSPENLLGKSDHEYPISWESELLSFISSDTQPAQDAYVRGSALEAFAAPTSMLVEAALRGESGSNVAKRGYAFIAAEPVLFKGEVVGAVVVQKSERALLGYIERVRREMLVQFVLLLVLGFIFWRVMIWLQTSRLKMLKNQLEQAIDTRGRVNDKLPAFDMPDELGDLARSFATMVEKLHQYNQYLESMASRLAHELRTPVSIVRSSLDNIATDQLDDENAVYVKRAHDGLERLSLILNNMSEATRLEHSLDKDDIGSFDLTELVRGCIEGYSLAFPTARFDLSIEENTVPVTGIPDLIAQLFDKLISNAVEFSLPDAAIKVRLTIEDEVAVLRVMNQGPGLPENMRENLFDSMVSVRKRYDGSSSHLGLGLYIAKVITEFHGGEIKLSNREDSHGVVATVRIPLMRLSSKLRL
jgi:two-component system sensor histidine kinase ChvG